MPTLVEELSARAKTLPTHDRARLAEELLDSLQGDSDAEADAAWDLEIERRVTEIEAGTVKLISAEDVHAEARRLIRRSEPSGITRRLASSFCTKSSTTSPLALGWQIGTTMQSTPPSGRRQLHQIPGRSTSTGLTES